MTQKRYSEEFKEQIVKECEEVGNVAMVARRHNLSPKTIYGWTYAAKKRGSIKPLPKNQNKRLSEAEKRLETISQENIQLKKLLGEKELELAILRDLRDTVNPR
ncbi:MAG: transposase [Mahella sp.]|nr:transposase [Mahella sp.]